MRIVREGSPTKSATVDVLCNLCGEPCIKRSWNGKQSLGEYGLINAEVSGGYMSNDLKDGTEYVFDLCEPCVAKLLWQFKIPAHEHDYDMVTGDPLWREDCCAKRVSEAEAREIEDARYQKFLAEALVEIAATPEEHREEEAFWIWWRMDENERVEALIRDHRQKPSCINEKVPERCCPICAYRDCPQKDPSHYVYRSACGCSRKE